MENATKALLIAGAILIAIVLIAVGIRVLSSTSGVTDSVDQVSTAMGVSVFNSQFEAYTEGTQSASEVKTLISKIVVTHRDDSEHKVTVETKTITGNNLTNANWLNENDIPLITRRLQTNYQYTVEIADHDSKGYISKIRIY